jgi:N-glycosylase/DNA lyase
MEKKIEAAIMARIDPEFPSRMKKQVVMDYPRFRENSSFDEDKIRSELKRVKRALSDAIYAGERTEELLVYREVLYLLAEDKGLM